jgi:hypothetical protein
MWFSPGTPVSSTNKTDCQYITEIMLKVALNTINQTINYLERNDMDVNKHERLSNITFRHKLK